GRAVDGDASCGDVRMTAVVDLHAGHFEAGGTEIGVDLLAQLGQVGPGTHDGETRKRFAHRRGRLTHAGATQEEVEEPHKRPPVNMRRPRGTHSRAKQALPRGRPVIQKLWETCGQKDSVVIVPPTPIGIVKLNTRAWTRAETEIGPTRKGLSWSGCLGLRLVSVSGLIDARSTIAIA